MPVNVRPADRDQQFLLPPSVADWLPEGHLAWFVLDTVAELDLSEFFASYREDGRGGATYQPAMMLAVLLYAYATGERSSRRIERRLHEDVAYRVLAANQQPDHATLARFRQRHQLPIAALFTQVLGLCVAAGLVDTELVAIDGTKMSADASYFANMTKDELAKEILAEAERVDAEEDRRFGERRGDELPDEWANPTGRRARIREALRQLEEQPARDYQGRMAERAKREAELGRKLTGPEPTKTPSRRKTARKANPTDPDSRVMASGHGPMQGYNAQAAATAAGQIVVAAEVSNCPNDSVNFVPMVSAIETQLAAAGHEQPLGALAADAGYWTTANASTETTAAEVLIATISSPYRQAPRPSDDKLAVLERVHKGELSHRAAGEILGVSHTWVADMSKRYFPKKERLAVRPPYEERLPVIERLDRGEISEREAARQLGVSNKHVRDMRHRHRAGLPDPDVAREQMKAKLAEPAYAALFKRRKVAIEPVFGDIKANRGYRRFTRRGRAAVTSEWRLICATHNLLKLWRSAPAA